MTNADAVIVTRTFKAAPERVFAAFEEPTELARWMAQPEAKTEVQALEVREGGELRVHMSWENGMTMLLYGTFKRVEKPSLLEFTWAVEGMGANSGVVTVEFAPHGTGTQLTLTHDGLAGGAKQYSEEGWNGWFDKLQALVDAG